MVLVTRNQYIIATKIHHITMDENSSHVEVRTRNGRFKTIVDKFFTISIVYTSEQSTSNNNGMTNRNDENRECSVNIRGAVHANNVFTDLIRQIREQMPDQLYLDTALENLIAGLGDNLETLKAQDSDQDKAMEEHSYVTKPKKVRRARKAKRALKKR